MPTNIHRYIHGHTQTHTHIRNNLPDKINLQNLAWQMYMSEEFYLGKNIRRGSLLSTGIRPYIYTYMHTLYTYIDIYTTTRTRTHTHHACIHI